jgi:hypothetical protein
VDSRGRLQHHDYYVKEHIQLKKLVRATLINVHMKGWYVVVRGTAELWHDNVIASLDTFVTGTTLGSWRPPSRTLMPGATQFR